MTTCISHSRLGGGRLWCAAWLALLPLAAAGEDGPAVAFRAAEGRLRITIDGRPFASYVYEDDAILRPYFAHVHAPGGIQVTRHHPPREGVDSTDHATMHPGVWLALGDLNGADFWRNRGRVRHAGFAAEPRGGPGRGTFTVHNDYVAGERTLGRETCRIDVRVRPQGYLLTYDGEFHPCGGPLVFGDQEEMGLGVRVAAPLRVRGGGGRIIDSEGRRDERGVWGRQADWCSYGGTIDGRRCGVAIMPHPDNFRRSWFHARDYGLLVANPFGRRAFTRKERSRVEVVPGGSLRLRFGVLVYAIDGDGEPDLAAAYRDYRASEPRAR